MRQPDGTDRDARGADPGAGSAAPAPDPAALRRAAAALGARIAAGDAAALDSWFQDNGGEPPVVVWSPGPDALGAGQLHFLLAHWEGLRGAAPLPPRSRISPLDLRPALGFVSLIDLTGDGDLVYRLYGTAAAQRTGFDMTGRSLWTFPTTPWLQVFHAAVYLAARARGLPLYTRHKPAARGRVLESERLALPLAEEPGEPGRILAGIVPAARR